MAPILSNNCWLNVNPKCNGCDGCRAPNCKPAQCSTPLSINRELTQRKLFLALVNTKDMEPNKVP